MKQIEVQIMQQSYVLTCPEGQEERLQAAVRHVDQAMTGIRDTGKVRSRDRVAVLAALNMAFDVIDREKMQSQLQQSHTETARLQEQTAQLQAQATQLQEQLLEQATLQASLPAGGDTATTELSEEAQAQLQRQHQLAEQLLQRLDQALAQDAQLI